MKIEASSFTLTRIVTFVPFYTLVNNTKSSVFICEEGLDNWTEARPEEVSDKKVVFYIRASNIPFFYMLKSDFYVENFVPKFFNQIYNLVIFPCSVV